MAMVTLLGKSRLIATDCGMYEMCLQTKKNSGVFAIQRAGVQVMVADACRPHSGEPRATEFACVMSGT